MNKFKTVYKILVNYGQGWEYEIGEETYKEARQRLTEYRENCNYPVKLVIGKELNPSYPDKLLPKSLYNKIIKYFSSDKWFYIKHPSLDYKCPIRYLKETRDIDSLNNLANLDTAI
jgi:hypothetical protein